MKVVVIGDIHFPYENKQALAWVLADIKRLKPTHIVQMGDLYDQYAFSRFAKKNIEIPEEELRKARKEAEKMWSAIRRSAPHAKCFQLMGNHDVRVIKRAEERIPEAQTLIRNSILELYRFEGVKTIEDDRDELVINNIVFMHGYRSKLGDHMRFNLSNTVCGHSHTGGVVFSQVKGKTLWELNAGFLADEDSEPLRYRPQTTSKWTLGYGVIDEYGPRFVPIQKKGHSRG